MATNRALRATTFVVLSWICLRVVVLVNAEEITPPLAPAVAVVSPPPEPELAAKSSHAVVTIAPPPPMRTQATLTGRAYSTMAQRIEPSRVALAPLSGAKTSPSAPMLPNVEPALTPVVQPTDAALLPVATRGRSWSPSLSAWAIVRSSQGSAPLATNSQLGASQAGFRVVQPLLWPDEALKIGANLRVSTPIGQSLGKEAGLGVTVQRRGRVPIEMIVERRVGFDRGGRNAFALIAVAGADDIELAKNTYLSGYGQSGVVGLRARDGFADGAIRIDQAIDRGKRWRIGAGLWGSAQPGVARLDIGPIVATRQRIGAANTRLAIEYRLRVAGDARPGSGPALSIGTDF